MNDVFVSYKREDKDFARAVAEALTARGLQVWWDVDLLPGDRFADEIQSVIAQSKLTVVLWSERSVRSTWVRAEARIAMDASQLLPVRLDDAAIPLPFNDLHTLDLSAWDGAAGADALGPLMSAVSKRLGVPETAAAEASEVLPDGEAERRLHDHDAEAAIWRSINGKDPSADELQIYLRRYPNGLFAELARVRLAQVRRMRWWRRPIAVATGLTALLAPVSVVVALVLDLPALDRVLGGDGAAGEAGAAEIAPEPVVPHSAEDRRRLRLADDAFLNIARPADMVPVFIEKVFSRDPQVVAPEDRPDRRRAILGALGIPAEGSFSDAPATDTARAAVMRLALDKLVETYRAGMPSERLRQSPLQPPPLHVITGNTQPPDALTCERAEDFLHFYRTYGEMITLYRATYMGAFGINNMYRENVKYLRDPEWVPEDLFSFNVPQPAYAEELGLDLLLQSGVLTAFGSVVQARADDVDPVWRARLAQFARDMLAYRASYVEKIIAMGRPGFAESYLTRALDSVPNPFGCTNTAQHLLHFEFEYDCGDRATVCVPENWFYLRDPVTDDVPRPAAYPGLHQAILMFWHRRSEAGTDPQMTQLLRDMAELDSGAELDFREIDRAIRAGKFVE
ncbi:MAG: toll/interleukin-1 receptor domain-containing protein [Tateyamaria sp.]